jgi:signal transduction histidine kinase
MRLVAQRTAYRKEVKAMRTVPARVRAARTDRRARDAAPALALALVFAVEPAFAHHDQAGAQTGPVLLAVASCVPLVVRSRFPLAVLAATLALDVLRITVYPDSGLAPAASLVALYTLAAHRRRALAWPVAIGSAAVLTAAYALAHRQSATSGIVLGLFDLPLLAAALGDTVRTRRAYLTEVEARAERAERTREHEARRAVAEERVRIARELHDVVAHHITLVNAQAGVAHHLMRDDPDAAYQALGQIKETSRAALDELRATVGLLRQPDDDPAPARPLPGLADLDELIDAFRVGGSQIDVQCLGDLEPVTSGVQLAAYRIIQEALTNTRRHAPGTQVHVTLTCDPESLHVTVANDPPTGTSAGPASPPSAGHGHRRGFASPPAAKGETDPGTGTGTGHGLIGMRERAAALGGAVVAGPDPAGGYVVRAVLPMLPGSSCASSGLTAEKGP